MNALDDFYTNHPFLGCYKAMVVQDEEHSQHFSKRNGFWT